MSQPTRHPLQNSKLLDYTLMMVMSGIVTAVVGTGMPSASALPTASAQAAPFSSAPSQPTQLALDGLYVDGQRVKRVSVRKAKG